MPASTLFITDMNLTLLLVFTDGTTHGKIFCPQGTYVYLRRNY